ncbi:carboxypeptidase M32 [Bacillus timonensis]|uniref:Metal-dependent carboxypeptidase n=1 Tax=Bacillus timonensis TaxID=1033734 RepID=A0A4S3PIR7_9BACI|nr:carboxypeptidase M32 [Bacillus timonensis]THE09280.1 carboxypeptidase M32 [Bacillus timonensis]
MYKRQQLLNTELQEKVNQFKKLDEKITHLNSVLALADWDQKVMAPKKGRSLFANSIGTLSTEIFKLSISKEMGELLGVLTAEDQFEQLDHVTKAIVRERNNFYKQSKSIPTELYNEYIVLTANANNAWEEARETNNFKVFLPFLERIVEIKKQFTEYYGYEGHPYNALLNEYEPGLTVEKLDPLFEELRRSSIDLLNRIKLSLSKPNGDIFERLYNPEVQKEFNKFILPLIGFDMNAGRLDETVHPFAQTINTGDVRITTRYLEDNVRSAIFGTIHEAGHGIYEQNINPELEGTSICSGASFGIHESQSRFLENMVGRSEEFWNFFYQDLQEHFPDQLGKLDVNDFYGAINIVEPSFIRVEADELTYNLHIMLRYEIEKGLISREIAVKDLPNVWNEKMKEYLGIVPPTDTLGVLQDVHWSFGGLGYFPSYSLGNLYAAQILNTIKKELPDFYGHIERGEFDAIQSWLKEKIHQYGSIYTPDELIKKITGESLNATYLVNYLEDKYSKVYQL